MIHTLGCCIEPQTYIILFQHPFTKWTVGALREWWERLTYLDMPSRNLLSDNAFRVYGDWHSKMLSATTNVMDGLGYTVDAYRLAWRKQVIYPLGIVCVVFLKLGRFNFKVTAEGRPTCKKWLKLFLFVERISWKKIVIQFSKSKDNQKDKYFQSDFDWCSKLANEVNINKYKI